MKSSNSLFSFIFFPKCTNYNSLLARAPWKTASYNLPATQIAEEFSVSLAEQLPIFEGSFGLQGAQETNSVTRVKGFLTVLPWDYLELVHSRDSCHQGHIFHFPFFFKYLLRTNLVL